MYPCRRYEPAAFYERYAHNVVHTFANRKDYPSNAQRASWGNVVMGVGVLRRLLWRVGVRGSYRRTFWRKGWPLIKRGKIEPLIHGAMSATTSSSSRVECLQGAGQSSFYAPHRHRARLTANPGLVRRRHLNLNHQMGASRGPPCERSSIAVGRVNGDDRSPLGLRIEGIYLGGFSGVRPEIVVALGLGQTRGHFPTMEEVAHDPIGDRPIIAVHAMMVRAQPGFAGELESTRCAKAHASQP